ncbi:helix-turn-helix domain-containing protein [Cupriavidus alkaliphilus]|uniref:helix-turn-helix domain-containing protein n=1 Tax=Cupriavidus alkaliphilus TaxID=942866 RepID=UPI001610E46D|nr:helix-turn-helix transcriptional regulator [Cupriavidus alkaliphilus]MBB2918305.1 putative DNA-binding transcriptional regulator AlpA [Cupriavidus alkaliphilus]
MGSILGIAYDQVKALPNVAHSLPNLAMPKTPTPPEHIGARLLAEMQERNLSHADVAAMFGVKPPSVYDWINYGRMAKKHLPKLVEVFGHSVNWWLTGRDDEGMQSPGLPRGLARLSTVLEGKSDEEIERIARALELLLVESPNKSQDVTRKYTVADSEFFGSHQEQKKRAK